MLANYVQESANAPGTATLISLVGAATGRVGFITAYGNGATAFYFMDDGTQAEWGYGVLTAGAPNKLSRDTVLGNTAGTTSRLNFAGVVRVYGGVPAERAAFLHPTTRDLQFGKLPAGPLAGFRNLLINATGLINQRGYASGTATGAANQYTLDRWRVATSGQALSWSDSGGVRTMTAPAGGISQIIEGASVPAGVYCLNWNGTATATVNGSAIAKGGAVTLGGGADVTIAFASGTVSLPQFEPGQVPTAFERRPIGLEGELCRRYYQSFYHALGSPVAGDMIVSGVFAPVMRGTPTLGNSVSSQVNCSAYAALSISAAAFQVAATFSAAGNSARILTASAEL